MKAERLMYAYIKKGFWFISDSRSTIGRASTKDVRIFLNGRLIENASYADTEKGFIVRVNFPTTHNEEGLSDVSVDYGKVEIRILKWIKRI